MHAHTHKKNTEWKEQSVHCACAGKIYKRQIKCVWCGLSFIDLHFNVCSVVIQTEISIDRVHHAYMQRVHTRHIQCIEFIIHDTSANTEHTQCTKQQQQQFSSTVRHNVMEYAV